MEQNAEAGQMSGSEQSNAPAAGNAGMTTQYAGFWIRVGAYLIDVLIIGIPSSIVAGIVTAATNSSDAVLASNVAANVVAIAIAFWNNYYLLKKNGASLGKKWLKLHVMRTDGSQLTWGRVLLRELVGKFVNQFTIFIGYLMVAFTGKKQGLHDMIGDTIVVKKSQ